MKYCTYLALFILFTFPGYSQKYRVLESASDHIKIEFNFQNSVQIKDTVIGGNKFTYISGAGYNGVRKPGEPWLPFEVVNLGIPYNSNPQINILSIEKNSFSSKFIIPVPQDDPALTKLDVSTLDSKIYGSSKFFPQAAAQFNKQYTMRFARIVSLEVSPFQFNPVSRELVFNRKIVLRVNYNSKENPPKNIEDKFTKEFLRSSVINSEEALNWIYKPPKKISLQKSETEWYDPSKDYYKIFLKEKGIYRLTFEQLLAAGAPLGNGVSSDKLEIFNDEKQIPIDIHDGNDGIFNSGDFIQFAGFPPKPSPFVSQNIYNLENVYWLSYQSDTPADTFKVIDGFPGTINREIRSTPFTIHYEKDSLYERLGYAPDGNRDFWFWGSAEGSKGVPSDIFKVNFPSMKNWFVDSNKIIIRADMHGLTTYDPYNPDHLAKISINGGLAGTISWDGQTRAAFQNEVTTGSGSIQINPQNEFSVSVDGSPINNSDVIRINWFEIEYWRELIADQDHFMFESSDTLGANTYRISNWQPNNMRIYIPQRSEIIINPQFLNNANKEVLFNDNVQTKTEYFCVSGDFFLSPDSIKKDIPSDLRNTGNGADYIIITHSKFIQAANKLADFRSHHLTGYENPRVKVVDVQDIYDEFSSGLLDPYAIKDFIKYTFENWNGEAPHYIALMGDMSYDYRHLIPSSRINYIPSIPYQQIRYGQAVADNNFVAVSGSDVFPDMAIGRISCETIDEANILVDKIINYPADNGKAWKQNVLLIGGGVDASDENFFRFNDQELYLQNNLIVPKGYTASKVFRYPANAEQLPFKGEGPDIREKINQGAAIVNYYGHGGGYQWDLVFLNDDIYQLENGGRLPMIFSVTCYTAHYDNQDVFGEQFNKVPGKGSIGFWGHTGITFWDYGLAVNNAVYEQIFNNDQYVLGDAILNAKSSYLSDSSNEFTRDHIALLTLLADPALELALPKKPDFSVKSSDIILTPPAPVFGQDLNIKLKLHNLGKIFQNDSVDVKLFVSSSDTSYLLKQFFRRPFGESDSVSFDWLPSLTGDISLRLEINGNNKISEDDYSDNASILSFYIFNLGQPDIVFPIDGLNTNKPSVDFLFSDIGEYVNQSVSYFIEIDTTSSFNSSQLVSTELSPKDGIVKWQSPQLPEGYYFWRARIKDSQGNSGTWSDVRAFSITAGTNPGYHIQDRLLKTFATSNIFYSDISKSLQLNKNVLPPRPADDKFIEDININYPLLDSVGLSCIASDGKYIYFSDISYYAGFYNSTGRSHIYKMGTGFNGTVKGELYGEIPNFYDIIRSQYCYLNGYIYVPFGEQNKLLKVSTEAGLVDTVVIPSGLLRENLTNNGNTFYLSSDGKYIYNLSLIDSLGNHKYTLRILDPSNGWQKAKEDQVLSGNSYQGFTSFFIAGNYLFAYENYESGFIRRYNLSSGSFEEEWISRSPFQGFYSWSYDQVNNLVYASVFRTGFTPKVSVYAGSYTNGSGTIMTPYIGPALSWGNLNYQIEKTGESGKATLSILGLNKNSKSLDLLYSNVPENFSIKNIDSSKYDLIKLKFTLSDSSDNPNDQIKLKNVDVIYITPPEILLTKKDLTLSSDSLQFGVSNKLNLKVSNIGEVNADSALIKLSIDNSNTELYSTKITIPADSSINISHEFTTNNLTGGNYHKIKASVSLKTPEFYTYNNSAEKSFYIIKDSVKPRLSVTFDGREIVNGDVVAYNPVILIKLMDNNPIPLDTNLFTIYLNSEPIIYSAPNVKISTSPYPNSEMQIEWKPELPDSENVLEVFAKDASGNLSDSAGLTLIFYVYKNPDLQNVFNYPNPFKNDTYFTFIIHGVNVPEEFLIKIYTIAGRLIRNISIPQSELRIGYNKIYWDGKDQDGDNIGNGVYFYKMISKNSGKVKSVMSKLAKVK